jgi:hypothetical protein
VLGGPHTAENVLHISLQLLQPFHFVEGSTENGFVAETKRMTRSNVQHLTHMKSKCAAVDAFPKSKMQQLGNFRRE